MTMINSSETVSLEKPTIEQEYEQQPTRFVYRSPEGRYYYSTIGEYEMLREQLQLLHSKTDTLRDKLLTFVRDDDISTDTAQSIADLFGLYLNREVSWEATVKFVGTAEIPMWADEDSLQEDLRFTVRWNGDTSWNVSGEEDWCDQFQISE